MIKEIQNFNLAPMAVEILFGGSGEAGTPEKIATNSGIRSGKNKLTLKLQKNRGLFPKVVSKIFIIPKFAGINREHETILF